MAKIRITDRDAYIIAEALATAIVALTRLPAERRPSSNIEDMKAIFIRLGAGIQDEVILELVRRFGREAVDATLLAETATSPTRS